MTSFPADLRRIAPQINHLTLAAVIREGRRTFQAGYKAEGRPGYIVAYHDDPIQALALCLLIRRTGHPEEPGVRYWHHPESSCVFKTKPGEPEPDRGGGGDSGLVEEIDASQYGILCQEYGIADDITPLPESETPATVQPTTQFDPDIEDML